MEYWIGGGMEIEIRYRARLEERLALHNLRSETVAELKGILDEIKEGIGINEPMKGELKNKRNEDAR